MGHADEDRVWVEEIEEISCEHRFGPSYVLSSGDRDALKAALGKRRAEASQPKGADRMEVVGCFRSYTRRPAALDDADQQLFRTFFPDARYIFLLLEPLSALECRLSFLSFMEGELPAKSPYPAVDLRTFLAERPRERAAEAVRAEPVRADAARAEAFQAPSPVPRREPAPAAAAVLNLPPAYRRREREGPAPRQRRRVVLPLIACVILSIGAALIYELWLMAREPRWSDLKLDARPQPGGDLELSWDATTPAAVLASRGILMVTDGGGRRNVELTPDEVRGGKLVYKPSNPDILFRLQLYGGGLKPSGDSLRVMTTAPEFTQQASALSIHQPEPPPQQQVPTPSEQAATSPAPPPPAATAKARPRAPGRNQSDRAMAERAELPDRAVAATAPEPVQQVQPHIPAGIRSRIESRMVVPIQVKVNRSGRVVEAVSPGDGNGLYRFLAEESVRAARQWRFTPAKTAHGQPVDGRKTIEFVFSPAETP